MMLTKKEPETFTYEEAAAYIEKLSTSPVQMEKGLYVHTYRPYLWQRGREQGSLHPLILYL